MVSAPIPPSAPRPASRRRALTALTAGALVAAGACGAVTTGSVPPWLGLGIGLPLAGVAAWIGLVLTRSVTPTATPPLPTPLPAIQTAPAPPPPAAAPASAASAEPSATPPPAANPPPAAPHVLVVDDNAVNQMVELELLRHLGFAVSVATNGRDALAHIERTADEGDFPALVLMDCQMPIMDGFAATRAWRQRERDGEGIGHLPILAVTANALSVNLAQCEMAGMDGLLVKPVTTDQLIAAIRRILPAWTPSTSAQRTCNPGVLERLRNSTVNPGFIHEVIAIFLADATQQLTALAAVARQGDAPALARAAHKLKGASLAVGLEAMADLCGRIDDLAEAGRIGEAQALVPQLEEAFARGRTVLQAYRR